MAGDIRVVWDQEAVTLWVDGDPDVRRVMAEAAGIVELAMKAAIPVSPVITAYASSPGTPSPGGSRYIGDLPLRPSGYLRSSVRVFPQPRNEVIIAPTADYAKYVNEDTEPHEIRSHGPWPLRNRGTGQVFGPVVQHPGTTGVHFTDKAIQALQGHRFDV